MQKIDCKKIFAHFEKQQTIKYFAKAIERRAQRRLCAVVRFFAFSTLKIFKIDAGNAAKRLQKCVCPILEAAHGAFKTVAVCTCDFGAARRRRRAVGEFCAENASVFDAENLKNRCRKCRNSAAKICWCMFEKQCMMQTSANTIG